MFVLIDNRSLCISHEVCEPVTINACIPDDFVLYESPLQNILRFLLHYLNSHLQFRNQI